MNANKILSADILDIIFENKNKAYGAYDLRKTYNKRLVLALGGTATFCLMFLLSMAVGSRKKAVVELPATIEVKLSNETKPKEQEVVKPQQQLQQQVQQQVVRNVVPRIVPDPDVKPEDEMKPVDELEGVKIGLADTPGEKGDQVGSPTPETKGTGIGTEIKRDDDLTKEFITVQQEARFPGGNDAWRRFLERNLNSNVPIDNGASPNTYTVVISFIVDRDGNVSDIRAENDPGFGTAQEAIRVIKKSQKWLPALQNGRNVIYRQKQSIVFRVNEE